jgi:hypothetical protein
LLDSPGRLERRVILAYKVNRVHKAQLVQLVQLVL